MVDPISTTTLGDRFDRAVVYALHIHAAQRRKMSGVPYSAHLLGVCAIALEFGANETEAIAALLHDAVEDCGGEDQLAQIRTRFGADVAAIVEGCTDSSESDPNAQKKPWYDRKVRYIENLGAHAHGGDSILLVSASDKLYNIVAILNDFQRVGPAVFDRFNAKRFGTLWYYKSLAETFTRLDGRQNDVASRISSVLDILDPERLSRSALLAGFVADDGVKPREKGAAPAHVDALKSPAR